MNRTGKASQRAFALMDVLAAVVILGLFIMPLLMARNNTILTAAEAITLRQARMLAEKKMGELELLPTADVAAGSGDFGEDYPGFTWTADVESTTVGDLVPETTTDEEEEEEELWGFGEHVEEEDEETVPLDEREVVILRLAVNYPTPFETDDETEEARREAAEAEGETYRPPGSMVLVRFFVPEETEEEESLSSDEPTTPDPSASGSEGEQERELLDLFAKAPALTAEAEEDDTEGDDSEGTGQ